MERTDLPIIQPGSKTGQPHALFAYTDDYGPDRSTRDMYNVFGDPAAAVWQKVGWGSSVTKEMLENLGIPIIGREPIRKPGLIIPGKGGTMKPLPKPFEDMMMDCPECDVYHVPPRIYEHLIQNHLYTQAEAQNSVDGWMEDFEHTEDGWPLGTCPFHGQFRLPGQCPGCREVDRHIDQWQEERDQKRRVS